MESSSASTGTRPWSASGFGSIRAVEQVYVCSYRVNQRKRLATLGRADVMTLDQARKKAVSYFGKVASNEDPQSELEAIQSRKNVGELCAAFVENHLKKKRVRWKNDDSDTAPTNPSEARFSTRQFDHQRGYRSDSF